MFQCFVWGWAGLIVGVSFIATPAKFLAPSIDLPTALDVGRSTFFVLKWLEAALICALIVHLIRQPCRVALRFSCCALILLTAVQYLALLPVLDARVELILNGETPDDSNLHHVYVVLELIRISLLICAGYLAGKPALAKTSQHNTLHQNPSGYHKAA